MAVTIQMGFKPPPCVMKANRNSRGFLSAVTTHREVLFAIYEPGPCWDSFELTYDQLWHNRYNLDTIKSKAILTLLCWDLIIFMWTWYQMYGGLKLVSNWIKIVLHRSYNPCTLRPCDALWPHRCVSILAQVKACFLTAPLYPSNVKNDKIYKHHYNWDKYAQDFLQIVDLFPKIRRFWAMIWHNTTFQRPYQGLTRRLQVRLQIWFSTLVFHINAHFTTDLRRLCFWFDIDILCWPTHAISHLCTN